MIDANKEFEIDACFRGWAPPDETQKLKDEIKRLREALGKISSFTQSTNLLWWQQEARAALSPSATPKA